mmetsp:Transcript_12254/g.16946  ORF Transcript_12254/g.16946 Transcript_12254/m.16946 type:complete len:81 (-) Transcript_12254:29-271(-)
MTLSCRCPTMVNPDWFLLQMLPSKRKTKATWSESEEEGTKRSFSLHVFFLAARRPLVLWGKFRTQSNRIENNSKSGFLGC